MAAPGTPGNIIPPGEDAMVRRVADLERSVRELAPSVYESILPMISDLHEQQVTLVAQQASLAATVADLASRVTVTTSAASFNTGSLPNDASFHEYGPDIPITINVPTGRLIVTVGTGETSLNAGGASVTGEATFMISGGVLAYGTIVSRGFLASSSTGTGASLMVQRSFSVPPGVYTITGKMRAWATGTSTASVSFGQPYLTVQITG